MTHKAILLLAFGPLSLAACGGSSETGTPGRAPDFGLDSLEIVSPCSHLVGDIELSAVMSETCTGCTAENLELAVDGDPDTWATLTFPGSRLIASSIKVIAKFRGGDSGDFPARPGVRVGFSLGQEEVLSSYVYLSAVRNGEVVSMDTFTRFGSSGRQLMGARDASANIDEIQFEFEDADPVEPLTVGLEEICSDA